MAAAPQYDASKVLEALISNAASLHAAAGMTYTLHAPSPTPTAPPVAAAVNHAADGGMHYDASRVMEALLATASALRAGVGSPGAAEDKPYIPAGFSNSLAADLPLEEGTPFLSSHLSLGSPHLPAPLPILASTTLLLLGVVTCLYGGESLRWGTSFPSSSTSSASASSAETGKRWFKGGVGGGMGGGALWASIALLIIAALPDGERTKLGPGGMYGVLIPLCVIGAAVGGRWKWAGRGMLGLSSGLNFSLLLLLSFHPPLLPRIIVTLVFVLVSLVLTLLLPLLAPHLSFTPVLSSRSLAIFSAFSGAFLVCQGIDLLLNPGNRAGAENLGWLDVLALLVGKRADAPLRAESKRNGYKGLLAGCWVMGVLGSAVQCWRWSKYGDDPAEQWNSYLSTYLSSFPGALPLTHAASARAGQFAPTPPWWQRLFGGGSASAPPPRYPGGGGQESPLTELPEKMHHHHGGRSRRTKGHHHEVDTESVWDGDEEKHASDFDTSSSSSDEEEGAASAPAGAYPHKHRHRHHKLSKRSHGSRSRPVARYEAAAVADRDEEADEVGTLVGSADAEFAQKLDKFGGSYKPAKHTSFEADGKRLSWQDAPVGYRGSGMSGSTAVSSAAPARPAMRSMKVEEVSSDSDTSSSEDDGRRAAGASSRSEDKGMVRSLSKMFGGQNKGPARYTGNRSTSPRSNSDAVPVPMPVARPRYLSSPPSSSDAISPRPRYLSSPTTAAAASSAPRRHSREVVTSTSPGSSQPTSPVAVPATPSLLNALQRINRAQAEAREAKDVTSPTGQAGEGFWQEVEERAAALRSKSPAPK